MFGLQKEILDAYGLKKIRIQKTQNNLSHPLNLPLQESRPSLTKSAICAKHVLLGIVAIIAGFVFGIKSNGMELWLLLSVFLVWIVEIVNTVFENVVDMFTDFHFHPIGKKSKDMAAGAVLMTSISCIDRCGQSFFIPKNF